MMVKDFNHHKSNGGIAQPTTIDVIKTFKHSQKGSRNGSSHRVSNPINKDSKTCSKCNTTHSYIDFQRLARKCHKCGFKNHFSSCCRSTRSNGQGQEWWRGRTPARSRSTERCHWPNRGRCSRSRSQSRSGSQTCNTHSIEIDWYDINDIDILKMFHSISRSKSVASITNNTDPDGKTTIITKLRIKLPYRNVADIMEVKIDNGAEANILPKNGFLKGSKMTLQCYDDGKLVNHSMITLKLKHYTENSFQDHQFFVLEMLTQKEIIIGHPVSVRLGLMQVLCKIYAKTVSSIETIHTNSLSNT